MEKSLDEIKNEIVERKQEIAVKQNPPVDTDTLQLLSDKKKELLQSEDANKMGTLVASEDIKANFASEASRINAKNVETAERELDTKTRQRRLDRVNAERNNKTI